jgi:rhodanese-related sulfurtransferase
MAIMTFLATHWVLSSLFIVFLLAYILFEVRQRYLGPKRLSPQEVVLLINQKQASMFDLRDKSKFDQGHIIGARHCAPADLSDTVTRLKVKHEQPILLICQMGQTSAGCGTALKKAGFTEVNLLAGGMQAWISADLPLHKS